MTRYGRYSSAILLGFFFVFGSGFASAADAPSSKAATKATSAAKDAAKALPQKVVKKVVKKAAVKKSAPSLWSWFHVGGKYAMWGLNQHGFLLGKDHHLDDADYVVQMLRIKARFGSKDYGVVTRFDAAQGWWGTDNSPNISDVSKDAKGNVVGTPTYNPYKLFRNKDTNYTVHFDWAYAYAQIPMIPFPFKVQVGRQYYSVGNKLVLDEDLDGAIITARPTKWLKIDLLYAWMSMGFGSVKNPTGLLMSNDKEFGEAHLFGGRIWLLFKHLKAELFGLYYFDNSAKGDATYLPNGVGYLRSRFSPNLSEVGVMGLSLKGKFGVLAGLHYKLEFDFLLGSDKVKNATYVFNMLDKNDGNLMGYNLYVNLVQKLKAGIPMDIGLTFGLGSGDDDKTKGPGNINKIQTMGFFPLTNVWEDSVMPDVGGISPQGLGSPVSRGYRELENTIALQIKLGFNFLKPLRLEASYTFLQATQPIQGFDANGPTADKASDIGHEIDANLIVKLYKNHVIWKALFGVFLPGKAAAYLINGNDKNMETVWELKNVIVVKF